MDEQTQCAALAPAAAGPSSQLTLESVWGGATAAAPSSFPADDGSDVDTLGSALAALVAEPAPRTLLWVPRSLEGRVADIAIACFSMVLAAHAAVEEAWEPPEAAEQAHLLLRALPELLLRAPTGAAMRDKAAVTVSADLKLAAVIRARLDRAELADWFGLARDALDDRAAASDADPGPGRDAAHGDIGATDSAAAFAAIPQLVAGKVRSGCVKSALRILDGFGKPQPARPHGTRSRPLWQLPPRPASRKPQQPQHKQPCSSVGGAPPAACALSSDAHGFCGPVQNQDRQDE